MGLVGGTTLVFLQGRFDPVEVLDLIERETGEHVGRRAHHGAAGHRAPVDGGTGPVQPAGLCRWAAPRVPPDLIGRLGEAFPNARRGVSTVYGMTDRLRLGGGGRRQAHGRAPATLGRPGTMVDLRIADPDADGVGEVLVRTPGQMLGYWAGRRRLGRHRGRGGVPPHR